MSEQARETTKRRLAYEYAHDALNNAHEALDELYSDTGSDPAIRMSLATKIRRLQQDVNRQLNTLVMEAHGE